MPLARPMWVAWTLAAACVTGCSALVDPDTRKLEPQPVACQLGDVATCQCAGGNWSTQSCNVGGSYDPCACGATSVSVGNGNGNGGRGKGSNAPSGEAGSPAR